jgi:ribonuclease T1
MTAMAKGNALSDWKNTKFRDRCGIPGPCRLAGTLVVLFLGVLLWFSSGAPADLAPAIEDADAIRLADLPEEAQQTLALIRRGGPYPYSRDGAIFANREGRLPPASRGTYREYTVRTPGSGNRGPRRIICAGGVRFWYTSDHYRSFRLIVE